MNQEVGMQVVNLNGAFAQGLSDPSGLQRGLAQSGAQVSVGGCGLG